MHRDWSGYTMEISGDVLMLDLTPRPSTDLVKWDTIDRNCGFFFIQVGFVIMRLSWLKVTIKQFAIKIRGELIITLLCRFSLNWSLFVAKSIWLKFKISQNLCGWISSLHVKIVSPLKIIFKNQDKILFLPFCNIEWHFNHQFGWSFISIDRQKCIFFKSRSKFVRQHNRNHPTSKTREKNIRSLDG